MGSNASGYRDGPFSPESAKGHPEQAQDPWQQPLPLQPRRGRPSNWAKKVAAQQYKEFQEAAEAQARAQAQAEVGMPVASEPVSTSKVVRVRAPTNMRGAHASKPAVHQVQLTPSPPRSSAPSPELSVNDDDGPLFVEDENPVTREDDEPEQSQPVPYRGRNATILEVEIKAMADEVRRWEARIMQQVATETKEMLQLIRDLAASSFSSKPPSATVRDMLSPEDQAKFRDQLLKATQLSLKADLVQTLKERDSETRDQQVYCVTVLAAAIVAAAFLVSPLAGWVADCLYWLTDNRSALL